MLVLVLVQKKSPAYHEKPCGSLHVSKSAKLVLYMNFRFREKAALKPSIWEII